MGYLDFYKDFKLVDSTPVIELPWRENKSEISRIPDGHYVVVRRQSAAFGSHFHVLGVRDRKFILIHAGNYHRDTKGCIIPGKTFVDIDKDGHKDVTNSKVAMNRLLDIYPAEWVSLVVTTNF